MGGKRLLSQKRLALFLGAVLLLVAAGTCQTEGLNIKVISRRTNVREKPSLKSDVIGSVKRGMILQVDGREGEWYKVRLPLKLKGYALPGYILQNLVEEVRKELAESGAKVQGKKISASVHKFGAGLGLGFVFLFDEDYGNGLRFNGNFCYKLAERLSLELEVQTCRVNVKADSFLGEGKLSMFPVQLSLRGNFPLRNDFTLYATCGLGYYLNDFSSAITIPEIVEELNNTWGVHFGGGVDYFFHKNIAFNADLRFCSLAKASLSIIYLGELIDTLKVINLNSFMFGVGIKYFF